MEAAQDVSPAEMKRLQRNVAELLRKDPDIAAFGSFFGSGSGNTLNTARFFIGLKPHEERHADRHADHRAAAPADRAARRRRTCSCSPRRTSRSADACRAASISTRCRTRIFAS